MTQYNQRKEPTFGEPSVIKSDKEENVSAEKPTEQKAKLSLSVHSKISPGHTFTPVMKRSVNNASPLLSLEEQAMLNQKNEQQNDSQTLNPKSQNGGFTFAPVQENHIEPQAQSSVEPEPIQAENKLEQEKSIVNTIERVIPVAAAPAAKAVVEKVPSKYRRLLIVLLLLLALLLAFFLLKPKAPETVENLQQGSSLPIEFRPVDEEEAKRAEAEAKALQEAQQAAQQQQNNQGNVEQTVQPTVNESTQIPLSVEPMPQTQEQPPMAAAKPVVQEPVKKPETTASVIHQSEPAIVKPATTPQPKPQVKVEVSKPQVKVETKPAPVKEVKAAPVVTAEPVKVAAGSVSSKTMAVPKGVSLMQVFRDHNLNISDVNAMSKVNGIVSNLKAGEKVTVRLDKDNRVTEMTIGSGGRFIRQANGTYIYK